MNRNRCLHTVAMNERTKTKYPWPGILMAMLLIYLSPFVSPLLCYLAFAICLYRTFRYDAKVFSTDYCLLLPLTNIFRASGGMAFMVYLCLIAAVYYFVCSGIRRNASYVLIILILNYFIARMQMNISIFLLSFGQMCLLCILIPEQDEESAVRATKLFCIGLIVSSAYAMIFRNTPQLRAVRGPEDPAIWGTGIMRFQGLYRDPNYYMTLVIVALALIAKLKDLGWIRTGGFLTMGILLIAFGALTYGKAYFLLLLLFVLFYIVWRFRNRKYFMGIFLSLLSVLTAVCLVHSESSPFAVILDRFQNAGSSISKISTGRTDVYMAYLRVITQDLPTFLFGLGLNAEALYKDPHNLYLEIAYYTGMIGLILMLSFFVALVQVAHRKAPASQKQNFFTKYVAVIMVAFLYCTLHGMHEIVFYGDTFLALLSIMLTKKQT